MKTRIHVLYITIISVLGFFAFDGHQVIGWVKSPFYAYISSEDGQLHTKKQYVPDLEWKEINGMTFPIIKGTNDILVGLNTRVRDGEQLFWNPIDKTKYLPKKHHLVQLSHIDKIPEPYRSVVAKYNKNRPAGEGEIHVSILLPENMILNVPVNLR